MQTVLIVIHLMIVLALVGVVLIQRSEGGGLGIGGGSGFMSARGAANALTRTTAILATAFFITSLALGILARYGENATDILDQIPASSSGQGVLDQLGGSSTSSEPAAPAAPAASDIPGTAPAAPVAPAVPAAEAPATPYAESPGTAPAANDIPGTAPAAPAQPSN